MPVASMISSVLGGVDLTDPVGRLHGGRGCIRPGLIGFARRIVELAPQDGPKPSPANVGII